MADSQQKGTRDENNSPSPYPSGQQGDQGNPTELAIQPGDLAPFWYSPYPNVLDKLSEKARNELKRMADMVGNKDVAARRWEVEQAWEARLFDRGYQYLLPRRGGGWILPPFATDYNKGSGKRSGGKWYGYETNIYATYGEIVTAALTRDIPGVIFQPKNPESDVDVTAANAASKYGRCFSKNNDLLDFQHQLVYYLRTDGRAVIDCEHIIDAQRFGRCDPAMPNANPETEAQEDQALLYLVRHGETANNAEGMSRGRSDVPLDQTGQHEAANAAGYLKGKGVGRLISSPVERARQSADTASSALGVPAEYDDRFASRDIGDLQGQPEEEAGHALAENAEQPNEQLPGGGESQDDLDSRVRDGLFDLLRTPSTAPAAVLTHDSVISSAFRLFHGDNVPPTDSVPPGGVAGVFPVDGGGFTIRPVYPAMMPKGELPAEKGDARGEEVVQAFGKLEAKVPINAQTIYDCPYIQICREYDFSYVKAMFPDYADDIRPGSAGAGENELDRIARINACLALEASYVTGDSMVRDCTIQRTWFRPGYFFDCADPDVRKELLMQFPKGCLAIFAGEAFVMARNENMDDHLTIVQAFPGSGMNRLALCSKLLSVQKRVNNWIDLMNAFFIRTIPQRVVDVDLFNMEAIQDQPAAPGDYIGVKRTGLYASGAINIDGGIYVEPTPTHQPTMPDFIVMFLNDLPQLLVGAAPTLFGSQANTDSQNPSSGYALGIQRDQALARLGTPWHAIIMATCSYFRQAVQLAAQCRKEPVRSAGEPGDAIRIELSDLKGDVLTYPEESADIPESWNQRQARYQGLLADAATNPFISSLLANPVNAKLAHDSAGLPDFIIPQADSWEKQAGEMELLLKAGPIPNPEKVQMEQQIAAVQQTGQPVDDAIMQQFAAMPDEISTVPIDPQTDDNATEAAYLLWWMNNPEGRKYRNGTPEERMGFANARAHWAQHDAEAKKNAPPGPQKPLSVSANVKDMPPEAAAAELNKRGLPASPQSVAATNPPKILKDMNKGASIQ